MNDEYPTAHDAEKCLLSSVMRGGGDVRQTVTAKMQPWMFDRHEDLAATIFTIAREGRPDPDTVKVEYYDPDEVDEVLEERPAPQNVRRHMRSVQESAGKLKLIETASEHETMAKNGHSFTEIATSLEEEIIDLTHRAGGSESSDTSSILQEILQELEDEQGQLITGIPTPFPSLNKMLRGLQDGELTIPFGSTSMGKTAWSLSVALHAATQGHPVAIHTLEMSEKRMHKRLLQMMAGVDHGQKTIPDSGMKDITNAAARLNDLPIEIVEASGMDYLSHRSSLRRLHYKHDIELAVVDYLQVMSPPPSESYSKKHHEVHAAAQGLKDTAKLLDIPIITPSQTTKSADRQKREPVLADLRQAGEEPTDVAIGLYRPDYYGDSQWGDGTDCTGQGKAIVAKHRNGPTGETKLAFVKEQARWYPLEQNASNDNPPF